MKSRGLTEKQQAKVRARFFRLLKEIGFQYQASEKGGYWWRKVDSEHRVCVGFDVVDQCLGGRTSWAWQDAKLTEEPLFGYSGTCSVGPGYGTMARLVDITLERVYYHGLHEGVVRERDIIKKAAEKIKAVLADVT